MISEEKKQTSKIGKCSAAKSENLVCSKSIVSTTESSKLNAQREVSQSRDYKSTMSHIIQSPCLTNFKDKVAICIGANHHFRYSFAQDRWEKLLPFGKNKGVYLIRACSLGDKVYALGNNTSMASYYIGILYNPDAYFSSQDPPHWQEVVVPQDATMSFRSDATFVPLNSTEIAILGGHRRGRYFGDVLIFNTSTNEFNKSEIEEGGLSFVTNTN